MRRKSNKSEKANGNVKRPTLNAIQALPIWCGRNKLVKERIFSLVLDCYKN